MVPSAISRYHELVTSKDARALDLLLAEDVVFHSPVVHTPQVGKSITTRYLTAAIAVFFNARFALRASATQNGPPYSNFLSTSMAF